jgi:hypothetical protein
MRPTCRRRRGGLAGVEFEVLYVMMAPAATPRRSSRRCRRKSPRRSRNPMCRRRCAARPDDSQRDRAAADARLAKRASAMRPRSGTPA